MANLNTVRPMLLNILTKCEQRCSALGLRGKKADDMAMNYLAGAAIALEDERDLHNWIGTLMVMVVSVRGMDGVRETIAELKRAQEARATA